MPWPDEWIRHGYAAISEFDGIEVDIWLDIYMIDQACRRGSLFSGHLLGNISMSLFLDTFLPVDRLDSPEKTHSKDNVLPPLSGHDTLADMQRTRHCT